MGICEHTRQCHYEQGEGGGARLLTTRIHLHTMSEALGLQARGAKLWVGEPQNLGSQTDASDACVHVQSIANDSLILSRCTPMFRSRLGTYKRVTNHLTTPISHPTLHEVLTFVTGPPTVAGLQRIMVQMQRIPHLVL